MMTQQQQEHVDLLRRMDQQNREMREQNQKQAALLQELYADKNNRDERMLQLEMQLHGGGAAPRRPQSLDEDEEMELAVVQQQLLAQVRHMASA